MSLLKEFLSQILFDIAFLFNCFLIDSIYLLKFYLGMLATFFSRFFNIESIVLSNPMSYSSKFQVISESVSVDCFLKMGFWFWGCFVLLCFYVCLLIFYYIPVILNRTVKADEISIFMPL